MSKNTIDVSLDYTYVSTEKVWQYDYGKKLVMRGKDIPQAVEVHFSLSEVGGYTTTKTGTTNNGVTEVVVPNMLLENDGAIHDYNIYAFMYIYDETSGHTEYKIRIPVQARPKPGSFVTPDDPVTPSPFADAITSVNDAADRALKSETNAKASEIAAARSAKTAEDGIAGIGAAKTEALDTIGNKKAESVNAVKAQETASTSAVNKAAEAIVADREQITKNKTDITSLKEDIDVIGIKNTPNMLDPNKLEKGKIIDSNGNVVDGSSNRSTSNLIKVNPSIQLKITTDLNQSLCQYDVYGNKLAYTDAFNSTAPITLNENAKCVRICIWGDADSKIMLYQSEETLSYIPYHKYSEKIRDVVNVYITDTEEEIYLKLYNACLLGNCDVYWEHGTYEFSTIFELIKTKYGRNTAYELPIGGNCRYFFNGSTLKATAISEDSNVLNNESLLGSWRKIGSYELHDGFLEGIGMVYVVHDESSGLPEPYTRKYKNIHMKYTADTSQPSGFCLGGGTGLNGYVEFDGCVFNTDSDSTFDGGYHGHSKEDASIFNVAVKNCYFSKTFQNGELATNESANLIFTGNTAVVIPSSAGGWNVMQWNNETHS